MRNIMQYPITDDEIIQCLEQLAEEIMAPNANGDRIVGDMRPLLLAEAVKRIKDHPT